jgi:ABC-type microcin C transport system duplicated ATPase subunit YejF
MSPRDQVPPPLVSIRDLSVSFAMPGREIQAVRHISFEIGKGETVALVGESGSGESARCPSSSSFPIRRRAIRREASCSKARR